MAKTVDLQKLLVTNSRCTTELDNYIISEKMSFSSKMMLTIFRYSCLYKLNIVYTKTAYNELNIGYTKTAYNAW